MAYCYRTLEDMRTKAALLDAAPAGGVHNSLALQALQARLANVLRLCLDTKNTRRFSFQLLYLFGNEVTPSTG
jgi:hypothetical protein